MEILIGITLNSIVPIFIMILLGYALDKKFALDVNTLTKVYFYIFMPAFSFANIYTTEISLDLLKIILFAVALLPINFVIGAMFVKLLKLPYKTGKAFENTLMFYNSGNIGVSLIILVYSNPPFASGGSAPYLETALSAQIMTFLVQNLGVNTIGLINSGGEGINLKTGALYVLKMPALYAVALAVLLKPVPYDLTATPIWPAMVNLRNGLVCTALVTLGIQLSRAKVNLKLATPYIAVFFRLVGGPAAAFLLIRLFGFTGVLAQAVFIASSTPTAVNTALLNQECRGDTDFAVQTVTMSTVFSAVTMSIVVYLAYLIF